MRNILLDLLPELLEKILFYCSSDDMKNLCVTCEGVKRVTQPNLFTNLEVPIFELEYQLFPHNEQVITHTSIFKFVLFAPLYGDIHEKTFTGRSLGS